MTGVIAGVLAGLLGVGGGIVIVPVLYHSFGFLGVDESVRMHVAVGTSLATIIPTGIASTYSHHQRGGIESTLLKTWCFSIAVGVVAGTLIIGNVSSATLMIVFASIALLVAINMGFRKEGVGLSQFVAEVATHTPCCRPHRPVFGHDGHRWRHVVSADFDRVWLSHTKNRGNGRGARIGDRSARHTGLTLLRS